MPRTTLVTGVSRRKGIGFAIAARLLRDDGARVFAHSYAPYDVSEPWGADPGGIEEVLAALGGESDRLVVWHGSSVTYFWRGQAAGARWASS